MPGWRRTYWVVWLANLITAVGMMSFLPFFPSLLEELGLSDRAEISLWTGLIFGAAPLSATFMSPVWGALGDRIGRRVMVVRAMLAIAVFVGAMAFAETALQLFLLRIGQGLFSGFIPPSITLVSVSAPADRQGRVAGDLQTALALGAVVGPMLGSVIAATAGHRQVFLWVAAGALASAMLVMLFAAEDAGDRQAVERGQSGGSLRRLLAGTRDDLRAVWRNRTLRGTLVLLFFLQFGLGATNPLLEIYVRDLVQGTGLDGSMLAFFARFTRSGALGEEAGVIALATGALFTGMALCNLATIPIWGRYGDRIGHAQALWICATGAVVSLFLQALAPLYAVLFLGRMLMGVSLAGTGPLAFGLAAAEISVDKRGGAFGVVFSARTLAVAVGGATGGATSAWIGIRGLMAFAGTTVMMALVAFGGARRRDGAGAPD